MKKALALAFVIAFSLQTPIRAGDKAVPKSFMGLPLLFTDDFESGKADNWEPSDAKAWQVVKQGENHVYNQFKQSEVKTPVRSPFNRAMIKGVMVGDFVFEARVQSTVKDYPHRDLCLFFGFQDPAHMYYVHLGKTADPHANSIFMVNNADRVSIAKTRTDGTNWDDNWHTFRIVRKVSAGSIEVFFDDMTKPVMTAEDRSFTWGQVGLGSFDDTGNFDDVRLWGKRVPSVASFAVDRMEVALDNWQPKPGDEQEPPGDMLAPKISIAGKWQNGGFFEVSTLSIRKRSDGKYDVDFNAAGCLSKWELGRTAQYVNSVLTLDRPVEEYSHRIYRKLYAVRIGDLECLLPACSAVGGKRRRVGWSSLVRREKAYRASVIRIQSDEVSGYQSVQHACASGRSRSWHGYNLRG